METKRPSTPDTVNPDGSRHMRLKRCCDGCDRELGDATDTELDCAMSGLPLPSVVSECGCEL